MEPQKFRTLCLSFMVLLLLCSGSLYSQGTSQQRAAYPIYLGAYYFDGWTAGSHHITPALKEHFTQREPVWGWVTSTASIMKAQIDAAADAGIAFFSFDWYFRDGSDQYPLNHALTLYLASPNRDRLKFCLMVANHKPFFAGPDHWETLTRDWIDLFREKTYLRVNGKPLLIFFSVSSLVDRVWHGKGRA